MNYRELLNRYKEGLLTEEERERIDYEIERYEAIEEYLSEIMDREFEATVGNSGIKEPDEETIKLKKSVNKRLRKVIFSSAAIVIALILSLFLVVSPLIDSLYYNPDKYTVGRMGNDMDFDIYAISELNMPGFKPSNVLVNKEGFGKYETRFSFKNLFTEEFYNVEQKIERGTIQSFSYSSPLFDLSMFFQIRHLRSDDGYLNVRKENVREHLRQLNPVSYISLGVSFDGDLTMEELYALELKYPDIEFNWAGIRTHPEGTNPGQLIGINLMSNSGGNMLLGDEQIGNKYPGFFIIDWLVNPAGIKKVVDPMEAQAYKQHYKSLLQYVIDRKEAIEVLERRPDKHEFYKSALEYAEEHGVKTYGVLVFGEARDLLEMIDKEPIKTLDFNGALVSKKYIQ